MRTLIFLLIIAATALPVASKTVKISKTVDNTEITLQPGRGDNEFRLLIEITSDTLALPHGPCTITVNHTILPCSVTRSVEIVNPRRDKSVITEYVTVGGRKLLQALKGESASLAIGRYSFELASGDLKQLRLAVASP